MKRGMEGKGICLPLEGWRVAALLWSTWAGMRCGLAGASCRAASPPRSTPASISRPSSAGHAAVAARGAEAFQGAARGGGVPRECLHRFPLVVGWWLYVELLCPNDPPVVVECHGSCCWSTSLAHHKPGMSWALACPSNCRASHSALRLPNHTPACPGRHRTPAPSALQLPIHLHLLPTNFHPPADP